MAFRKTIPQTSRKIPQVADANGSPSLQFRGPDMLPLPPRPWNLAGPGRPLAPLVGSMATWTGGPALPIATVGGYLEDKFPLQGPKRQRPWQRGQGYHSVRKGS